MPPNEGSADQEVRRRDPALDHELKLELPKEIKRARELGDLRENAEYQAAKERQRLVESRISMLQKRVERDRADQRRSHSARRVGFGSTVHVKDANGEKLVYQLVMPEDADAEQGPDLDDVADRPRAARTRRRATRSKVIDAERQPREFEIVKLVTIHDE